LSYIHLNVVYHVVIGRVTLVRHTPPRSERRLMGSLQLQTAQRGLVDLAASLEQDAHRIENHLSETDRQVVQHGRSGHFGWSQHQERHPGLKTIVARRPLERSPYRKIDQGVGVQVNGPDEREAAHHNHEETERVEQSNEEIYR
jgi:hypothetical protein